MKRPFNSKLSPVRKISEGGMHFSNEKDVKRHVIILIFLFISLSLFIVLIIRLFQLTVVKGQYYRRLSEENRTREVIIEPKYGKIVDRKGFVLAQNSETNLSTRSGYIRSERTYYYPEETAHILGYRQIADVVDIKNDYCIRKLVQGEMTGKKGIEKLYDCDLRGVPGKKLVEVNATGEKERTIAVISPVSGKDIQLALDIELQKAAFKALNNRKGTVIALKPSTGEVLALVSTPSYHPEAFEKGLPEVSEYFVDKDKPLFDRATQGTYPPGSVIKPIFAVGGLEDKVITEKTIVQDDGFLTAGSLRFGNWYYLQYGKTEGPVDVVKALRRSNDTFFYKLGSMMGPEKMRQWAQRFGLGSTVGIGLDESEGLLPSPFWKTETLKENWYLGDTYNYSIGQGYMLATPIQIASALSAFANDGSICKPQLLKNAKAECKKIEIGRGSLSLVQEGMKQACATGGTGWPLFDFKVRNGEMISKALQGVAEDKKASVEAALQKKADYWKPISTGCKTGTAESHAVSGVAHAWFVAYAPFEKPEILVTVFLEEAGQGSDIAGPVAKDVLSAYFERNE